MIRLIFYLSLAAASSLTLMSFISLWRKDIQFWPPPDSKGWQYRTFWSLFRLMFVGVVLLSFLYFDVPQSAELWWRTYLGLPLAIFGFGSAFHATYYLGWKNAHGSIEGLQTEGWYRWSRNPIYVVTIFGIVGVGLLVNSVHLWAILLNWIIFYIVAPFLEEPWLEKQYGHDYLTYKKRVPRFIGIPKKIV